MSDQLEPKWIEKFLQNICSSVERLSSHETRAIWSDWHKSFPLPKKSPHAISENSLVQRLLNVTRRRNGSNAIQAFHRQESQTVVILTLETLAGWLCQCESPPEIETIAADILVTPTNYEWVYAVAGASEKESSERLRYVFVDRLCFPDVHKQFA